MANEEIKYFNVKNTSVRLVHIGGVSISPEQVKSLIDDDLGINRADVESSEYLEETEDEPTTGSVTEEKPVQTAKKGNAKTATAKTPTGAGWSAKS